MYGDISRVRFQILFSLLTNVTVAICDMCDVKIWLASNYLWALTDIHSNKHMLGITGCDYNNTNQVTDISTLQYAEQCRSRHTILFWFRPDMSRMSGHLWFRPDFANLNPVHPDYCTVHFLFYICAFVLLEIFTFRCVLSSLTTGCVCVL